MSFTLYPKNTLPLLVTLKQVDPETGVVEPVTTGTHTAFLALTATPTAEPADISLVTTAVYTGRPGKWLVQFEADVLTPALLATLFASTPPQLILEQEGVSRVYLTGAYVASKPMRAL